MSKPQTDADRILDPILDNILRRIAERSPDLAHAVLRCAVPRWFDGAVIAGMCPAGEALTISETEILQGFQTLPFCQPHPTRSSTWVFSEDFRPYLLSRQEVKDNWEELHTRAATTFKRMLDDRGLEGEARFQDLDWRDLAIEWTYHTLCLDPSAGLEIVRRICAEALAAWQRDFCSEFLGGLECPDVSKELGQLRKGVKALLAYKDVKALDMFYSLVGVSGLTPEQESVLRYWIGVTHLRDEGRLAPALEQLERARELTPQQADVYAEIAAVYYSPGLTWGRLDLALRHANRAKELAPDEAVGYVALGTIHAQQEDWDGAIERYQKAIQVEPEAIDGYVALGEAYAARRDVVHAVEMIDKAVEIGPGARYFAFIRKGNAYRDARRYEESRSQYEQAIEEAPDRIEAYLELGALCQALGQSTKAEESYGKAIGLEPDVADGYVALARLYNQQGKWARALSVCRQAIERRIRAKALYIVLSEAYGRQDRLEDLKQAQEQLVHMDAGEAYAARCAVGDALLAMAQRRSDAPDVQQLLERAQGEYEEALEIDRNRAWAYMSLAELAVLRGDGEAVREQERLIGERAPWARYDLLVNLGGAYLNRFQHVEAEKALHAAVELAPHRPAGWRLLSELYNWRADPAGVRSAWSELVRIDPSLAYDAHIAAGDACQQVADYARARAEYVEAQHMEPDTADAYMRLAAVDEAEGASEDAVTNYRGAADRASDFAAVAYARIAAIRRAQGRHDEAEKAARAAILFDAEHPDGYVELALIGTAVPQKVQLVKEARDRLASVSPDRLYDLDCALGDAYHLAGDYDKAQQAYSVCLERDPGRVDACVGLGWVLIRQERYEEAREHLAQALENDGTNVDVYVGLAELCDRQADVQGVVEAWNHIVELEPSARYGAHLAVGATYEKAEQLDVAEQRYRAAIELSPWRPEGYVNLGSLLRRQGRSEEARDAYQKVKQVANVDYLDLGRYYEQQEKLDDAMEAYRLGAQYEAPDLAYDAYCAIGSLLGAQERYDEAGGAYQQAIQADPKRPEAYVGLVYLQAGQGQWDEAIQVCHRMAQQPGLAYDAQLSIGSLLAEQQKYDEAEQAYRQAIEVDPQQVGGYLRLAGVYEYQGDLEAMERCVLQASEVAPDDPDACAMLARLHEHQGRWDEAIHLYARTAELQPGASLASAAYERMGDLLIDQERYGEAEGALRSAVESDPANAGAYYSLGAVYEGQGDLDQAAGMYTRATEVAPEYGDAYIALARVYGRQGDVRGIAQIARQILESVEEYDAHVGIAAAYQEARLYEWAIDELNKAVSLGPERLDAHIGLGWIYEIQQRWARAQAAYEKVGQLSPELQPDVHLKLGQLSMQQGNLEGAENEYRQVIDLAPERPDGYLALAELYEGSQRWDEAVQAYGNVIEVERDAPASDYAYVAHFKLGQLFMQQGDLEGAENECRRLIDLAPERADGYFALAQFYRESERWDEAIQVYNDTAGLGFDAASSAYLYVGDIYRRLGRMEEMRQTCARVVSLVEGTESPGYDLVRRQGLAHFMRGEYAQAAQALHRALEMNQADAKARFYLTLNLLCQGEPAQAQEELGQGIGLAQHKDDYVPAIEEARVLAARVPQVAGAKEMLQTLVEAKEEAPH